MVIIHHGFTDAHSLSVTAPYTAMKKTITEPGLFATAFCITVEVQPLPGCYHCFIISLETRKIDEYEIAFSPNIFSKTAFQQDYTTTSLKVIPPDTKTTNDISPWQHYKKL
jgi:hypothetical protein